jgi:DNA-directed RNA polymerase subunit RPC12/RpoP
LLSWGLTKKELVLKKASLIKIKVQILDDKSDYLITLKQDPVGKKDTPSWIVTVVWWVGMLIILTLWSILFYCCYQRFKNECRRRKLSTPTKEGILQNMKSGKYSQLYIEYGQDSCVICLETFEHNSQVHIINECSHVFHTRWLTEWVSNVRPNSAIHCPHCSVEVTIKSRPKNKKVTVRADLVKFSSTSRGMSDARLTDVASSPPA